MVGRERKHTQLPIPKDSNPIAIEREQVLAAPGITDGPPRCQPLQFGDGVAGGFHSVGHDALEVQDEARDVGRGHAGAGGEEGVVVAAGEGGLDVLAGGEYVDGGAPVAEEGAGVVAVYGADGYGAGRGRGRVVLGVLVRVTRRRDGQYALLVCLFDGAVDRL